MLNYLVALHAVTRGIDVKFVSTPTLFIIARTRNLTKENGLSCGLLRVIRQGN